MPFAGASAHCCEGLESAGLRAMALPQVRVPEEVELLLERVLRAAGDLRDVEARAFWKGEVLWKPLNLV